MHISILDVGHGNSAVLQTSDKVVVIDAGPGTTLLEYLLQEKIRKINLLLISHADADHIDGVSALLAADIEIESVRLNSDALKASAMWNDMTYEISMRGVDFEPSLTTNKELIFESGSVRVEVIAPNSYLASRGPGSTDRCERKLTSNSICAVLRVCVGEEPVIVFGGDIDRVGLENVTSNNTSAPILVFPHHGGRPGGNIPQFVAKLCGLFSPTTVIFSIGRVRPGFPRKDIMEELSKFKCIERVVCTQLSNACSASVPEGCAKHLGQKFAAGRDKSHCCGGTIEIEYKDGQVFILPERTGHLSFVKTHAGSALCACLQ